MKQALSKRQLEMAELGAWGASKKQIADRLNVKVRTVENTFRIIYEKLKIQSVGQLSAWWFCIKYNIPKAHNPLAALCFITLFSVSVLKRECRRSDCRVRYSNVKREYNYSA